MTTNEATSLKFKVKEHWEAETCGTRYSDSADRKSFFDQISAARYKLEPYIKPFADFQSAKGKAILEIGVGAGADFYNWCEQARHATGVDLTDAAIALTRERLELNQVPPEKYALRRADAENLPFANDSFDLVYSWGVLHHTPDTARAFREACRVLKPGGTLKAMIYHTPCWGGLMLYLRYGLARGRFNMTMKEAIFNHLESPGTKSYTLPEARCLLAEAGFSDIEVSAKLGFGDLLESKPSKRYNSAFYKLVWMIYPRWFVRLLGDRYGMGLLITANKAPGTEE
jgi:ubiquinone/menaquinone biosynthesis C-methylase UbiE